MPPAIARVPKALVIAATAAGALLLSVSALAGATDEWHVTPYLWAASFDGTLGSASDDAGGDGTDIDFDHLWDNLRLGGAMLNVNWRRGRWTAFGDWTYARVTSESPTRVPALYQSVEAEITGHIVQGFAGRELLDRDRDQLDIFAGARYFDLDVELELAGAGLPGVQLEGADRWLDVVGGLRWVHRLNARWQTHVQVDAGAGGSDLSWQAIASVGCDFAWGSVLGGWRHLKADYSSGSYRLDAALAGPFIGVTFTF